MHEGEHRPRVAREQFLRAVPEVALAQPGDRRVDRDEERRCAGLHRALEAGRRDVASADQIELVPERAFRPCSDFVHAAPRKGRERVGGSGLAGGARGHDLAARIEHPAAADRRERKGERELVAEHFRAQVRGGRDGTARPEQHVIEDPDVLAEGHLAVGTAVDVVESHARQAALGQAPQVGDVEHARGIDSVSHGFGQTTADCALASTRPSAVRLAGCGTLTESVIAHDRIVTRWMSRSAGNGDFLRFWPGLPVAKPAGPSPINRTRMEFRDYAAKETAALFSRLLASQAEASAQHLRSLRDALDAASRGIEDGAASTPAADEDVQELIRRLNTAANTAARVTAQKVQKEAQAVARRASSRTSTCSAPRTSA